MMVQRQHGNLLVMAHRSSTLTQEEWEMFLEHLAKAPNMNTFRTLVFTEGAAPDALQRGQLYDLLAGRMPIIAIVSDAPLVRAAGTAASWFNRKIRVFGTRNLEAAIDHLELPPAERAAALKIAGEVRHELARTPDASAR